MGKVICRCCFVAEVYCGALVLFDGYGLLWYCVFVYGWFMLLFMSKVYCGMLLLFYV